MKKHNQDYQIDSYIDEVSRLLPYPYNKKKTALDELRIDVQSAMKDSNSKSPSEIFGTPLEVAKNVSQSQDWHNERAGWIVRFFAWILDLVIQISILAIYVVVGFLLIILLIMPYDEITQEFNKWEDPTFNWFNLSFNGILLIIFISIISITTIIGFILYNIVLEHYYGATMGKKIFKLLVVDQSGIKITWKQAIIRNLSKILVVEELLPFDVLIGIIREKNDNQRALDVLAETFVIKL
ncbi:MAG: RDD family protein [Candidatus Hodarchaeales archaeon]